MYKHRLNEKMDTKLVKEYLKTKTRNPDRPQTAAPDYRGSVVTADRLHAPVLDSRGSVVAVENFSN